MLGTFEQFMEKARTDNLREWLTLEELEDYLYVLEADAKLKLYFVAHAVKSGTLAKVEARAIVGELVVDDALQLKDIRMSCLVETISSGDKNLIIEASIFMPNQLSVSRVFKTAAARDYYYDELIELNSSLRESQMYADALNLRRLLGNDPSEGM